MVATIQTLETIPTIPTLEPQTLWPPCAGFSLGNRCVTTSPPVTTTSPPVKTTSPPVNTTSPPVNTTSPPVNTTSPPVNTTSPPVTTTSTPDPGTSYPPTTSPVPASASSTNAPPLTPTPTDSKAHTHRLGTTTIVLISIGGIVVIIMLLTVLVCRHQNRQKRTKVPLRDAYVEIANAGTTEDTATDSGGAIPEFATLLPFRLSYCSVKLDKIISQGGYGEVWWAKCDNDVVAVKCLLPSRRSDLNSLHSFVKEIHLTATLQHACIVQCLGAAWEDATTLCMVSEFMDGGDLRTLLATYARNGHANGHNDTKLRIAVQAANAMTYLHSLDPPVIHRDLKSRNILLTRLLDAKIIDFGVSCECQDVTMTAGVGTSRWMAPEVMLGKRYDEKADVFSFGVILSELDTHEIPYDHVRDPTSGQKLTDIVLLQLISQGRLQPRFTDMTMPAIMSVARDCLQLDPSKRPTATELVYRIHQCLWNETTLTDQTRSAIDSAMLTAETRATTRSRVLRASGLSSTQVSLETRVTTRKWLEL